MTALRQLSAVYIATAGAFAVAMAMSAHPGWTKKAESAAAYLRIHGAATAIAVDRQVLRPGWAIASKEVQALGGQVVAEFSQPPPRVAGNAAPKPVRSAPAIAPPPREIPPSVPQNLPAPAPVVATAKPVEPPPHAAMPPAELRGAESDQNDEVAAVPPRPALSLAPQAASPAPAPSGVPAAAAPSIPPPSAAEIASVEQRLKDSLTSEMLANFELFLYVSKAEAGPWAQRMYVFQKQASGDLVLLHGWPVSTGREKIELTPSGQRMATFTPEGYYELDPKRSYVHYRSGQWGQPMPYAMFFNWVKDGDQTGLAIHAATGEDVALLGSRASAGCIHLAPENARTLFSLIRTQFRGLAPRFATDRRTGTMSNDGILLHDRDGHLQMADGYKVLVFIENYGGENVVATLF